MRPYFSLGKLLIAAAVFASSSALAAEAGTPLAGVELVKLPGQALHVALPAGAPQPVLYFLKNATAPSCGLLTSRSALMITPILETSENETYPNCESVTDAAVFGYRGATCFVYRYLQRDTREDTSINHFFVSLFAERLQPLDTLNTATPPPGKPITDVAAWAKLKLISEDSRKGGFETVDRNSIITSRAILHVSRNTSTNRCRTEVDIVSKDTGLPPVTVPCNGIIASAYVLHGTDTYFIVLVEERAKSVQGQIYVAEERGVHRRPELEQRLAAEIRSRDVTEVQQSLRTLLGTR